MATHLAGRDEDQAGVTRRALLAAGTAGLAATAPAAAADDGVGGERTFEGEAEDGKVQAALDRALEKLDGALNEGGVRDATAAWKVAAISGMRGTFKGRSKVKVTITATRSPGWGKR
jgi:hypothetical protein